MLVVTGSVTAKPETFEALLEAGIAHTRRSRTEPGCLRHTIHIDAEDPLKIFFYEEWADRAALDTHFAQAGSHGFMDTVRELSAKASKVRILPIVER